MLGRSGAAGTETRAAGRVRAARFPAGSDEDGARAGGGDVYDRRWLSSARSGGGGGKLHSKDP